MGIYANFKGYCMDYWVTYPSPLGELLLLSDGEALTGLYMDTQAHPTLGEYCPELPVFAKVFQWLDSYFLGKENPIAFSLSPVGTAFQKQVWKILLTIPFGHTQSYGEIARQIRASMSPQAVGGAVGRNPISIIPCHRCVGAKGQLTGYAGGLDNKLWLLRHEEEHK